MIHPDTELRFINDVIGYGVFAKKLIPKGTITWVQDELDQIFTPQKAASLSPLMQEYLETYCFTNNEGNHVLCWDNAKFVNHSFNSSCMSTAYDFEIAVRDIHPGEQLTDDYGYLNISEPFEVVDEGTERKIVYPDDLLRHYKEWDDLIRGSFNQIKTVDQPMKKFISSKTWTEFQSVMNGKSEMRSLLTCYYDRSKMSV
ncbi:MAG: SET domain-containing protein-lysine N-methyltransferase [Flavobacterium sp.]|nr:MAG: SET domain-containing protein-lysine N-methyltransferase [Flavobacterium sp.]